MVVLIDVVDHLPTMPRPRTTPSMVRPGAVSTMVAKAAR
jgi:hypothetical protein